MNLTQDSAFLEALREVELYGNIDLFRHSSACKEAFAQAAEKVALWVESQSDEHPEYVARLRWIADEVRETVVKEKK